MEDAPGTIIENAIIILVAGAIRLRVLDDHMMIGQLVAPGEIQTIKRALDSFAGEGSATVISRKTRARSNRMRDRASMAPHSHVDGRHMQCVDAFSLELAMLHDRIIVGDQLSDGVRKVGTFAERDVAFEEGEL